MKTLTKTKNNHFYMYNNIINALKVTALAVVLSFGISYVYAWTAPTTVAPGGNTPAPINTSATAQTKTGNLNVLGSIGIGTPNPAQALDVSGSAQITGTIWGGGGQKSYGATTIRGEKNGWSGINFAGTSGVNYGTLMMNPSASGFYNTADNNWRLYVTDTGGASGGNVYANNYYIGASGKWASQAGVPGQIWSCPCTSNDGTTYHLLAANGSGKRCAVGDNLTYKYYSSCTQLQ